ncbi:MAG: aminotransferase class III-fold pyridoxal phosphate-dependent enzyme [Deltaproteobacteria bacterium]|nr:MAG: aminotransferase class III-fold pyridoxal phosphate-dependent enzyme [Deltaproteobacteria bacterium]
MASPFFHTWTAQRDAKPVELVGGQGAHFETADGKRWLDLGSLSFQANLGHGQERMVQAIVAQARRLALSLPAADFPAKRRLAERLLELAGPEYSKVFFTLGGAEANENALKMARLFTGRHKTVSRFRSYHGATLGALSVTGDWRRGPIEPLLSGALRVLDCYCARCPFGQVRSRCDIECAQQFEEVLSLEGGVGAVILEPVPGANGVLVPPAEYWPRVRAACDAHGALLVADEVLTGFGRTGRWFAHQHFGVTPDLITVAKGLTGGYATLGAVIVHRRVAEYFEEAVLVAGLTGYGHPLACAAALEAIAIYEEEGLVERAARLEPVLLSGLETALAGLPVREVRGLGLLACAEFEASPEAMTSLFEGLRARGIHVHGRAREGWLILAPPLIIEESELEQGLAAIREAAQEAFA